MIHLIVSRRCIIKRNTTERSRLDPATKEPQNIVVKKVNEATYKVHQQEVGEETEPTIHATSAPAPKPWNPPSGLKFLCPMANHKHEVSMCAEFFALSLRMDG